MLHSISSAVRLFAAFLLISSAAIRAQSTAFSYQGHLMDGESSATGLYDIRFILNDTAEGGSAVAAPFTAQAVRAEDGIFTTMVDFGALAFSGGDRWIELAVRPAGSAGDFTVLSPRQPVTSVPYAVRALSAATAGSAATLSGTLTPGNIPAGSITAPMLAPGITLPGSVTGGGIVDAVPGTRYEAAGNVPTDFQIPATAAQGATVSITGVSGFGWNAMGPFVPTADIGMWRAAACSADGGIMMAGANTGSLRVSTDGGHTWTTRLGATPWRAVACSADGVRQVAARGGSIVQYSPDKGVTWYTPQAPSANWSGVACSSDGQTMLAVAESGEVIRSVNGGAAWAALDVKLPVGESNTWTGVACSANAQTIAITSRFGRLRISKDGGINWGAYEAPREWTSVAVSADGIRIVAVAIGSKIYQTVNSGLNWMALQEERPWISVAVSPDGSRIAAAAVNDRIYYSRNYGETWIPRGEPRPWTSVAMSADGKRIIAGAVSDYLYLSDANFSGGAGTTVTLQHIGGGHWRPVQDVSIQPELEAMRTTVPVRLASAEQLAQKAVQRAGDTMTGTLTLPANGLMVGSAQLALSNGRVGLNTANPSGEFPMTLRGNAVGSDSALLLLRDATDAPKWHLTLTPTQGLDFAESGVASRRLHLAPGGGVGIGREPAANRFEVQGEASKVTAGNWLANSDRRIKEDIRPIRGALEKLDRVRLVDFRYRRDYRDTHEGIEDKRYMNVVAQEFAEVFPEHVKGSGEKLPDGAEILQVDTYPLTIYSAAAVQELHREAAALKARVAAQEQRLAKLEALLAASADKKRAIAKP